MTCTEEAQDTTSSMVLLHGFEVAIFGCLSALTKLVAGLVTPMVQRGLMERERGFLEVTGSWQRPGGSRQRSSIFLKTGWRSSGSPPIFWEIFNISSSSWNCKAVKGVKGDKSLHRLDELDVLVVFHGSLHSILLDVLHWSTGSD